MTATIDDIANTLGEFEALAQKTGEWDGADPVEFSADGVHWLPVWVPVGDDTYPPFARATVHRKGVAAPTVMIVAWAESLPAVDDWRELWERKPMKLFGSFALRSAIRHAFRDVVGDLTGPDEDRTGPTVGEPARADDEPDWDGMLANAPTDGELDEVWAQMRTARARTGAREKAYRERKDALTAEAWEPAKTPGGGEPSPAGPPASDQESHGGTVPGIARRPQDHLPGNRAERRDAARKKGRRK